MNVDASLSNLLIALKVLGVIFVVTVVVTTWVVVRELGRSLTGRGG